MSRCDTPEFLNPDCHRTAAYLAAPTARRRSPKSFLDSIFHRALRESYWEHLLAALSNGRRPDFPETHLFFGRALRQAYAANLSEKILAEETRSAVYPFCGSVPVAAMLREEAQGAKRSLVCSLCLSIWEYKRIVCPACSEEEFEKLPTFRAEQFQHVLVEACDRVRTRGVVVEVDVANNG